MNQESPGVWDTSVLFPMTFAAPKLPPPPDNASNSTPMHYNTDDMIPTPTNNVITWPQAANDDADANADNTNDEENSNADKSNANKAKLNHDEDEDLETQLIQQLFFHDAT